MMQIEIDDCTYERIKEVADLLDSDISDILYNPITDGLLNEYYKTEISEAEAREE